jgi:hypothetical protein
LLQIPFFLYLLQIKGFRKNSATILPGENHYLINKIKEGNDALMTLKNAEITAT